MMPPIGRERNPTKKVVYANSVPASGSNCGKKSLFSTIGVTTPYRKKSYHSMVVPMALAKATFPAEMRVSPPLCIIACIFPPVSLLGSGALGVVEAADIATPRHLLEQREQRGRGERIIRFDRAGRLERVELRTRIERREQEIVIGGKRATLPPQLRNAGLEEIARAAP